MFHSTLVVVIFFLINLFLHKYRNGWYYCLWQSLPSNPDSAAGRPNYQSIKIRQCAQALENITTLVDSTTLQGPSFKRYCRTLSTPVRNAATCPVATYFSSQGMSGPRPYNYRVEGNPDPVGIRTQVIWLKDEHVIPT